MNLGKVIRKRLRAEGLAADIHAVLAVNTGRGKTTTDASSRQRVVVRSGERRKTREG